MKRVLPLLLLVLLVAPWSQEAQAQQSRQEKLAQTGMKFLSMSNDPRAAALGDAVTAIEGMPSSFFYNPAGIARQTNLISTYAAQTQWIADINYNHLSVSIAPMQGRYGVIGLTVVSVDYGDFIETVRFDNTQGFIDLDVFSPSATAFGLGYSRALTDRFSVGGHVKYATLNLGPAVMSLGEGNQPVRSENDKSVLAYDFGVLYHTGFRSLTFAMSARNFAQEVRYNIESFELPLTFRIGLAMDMLDLMANRPTEHSLMLSVDADRPRDYSESLRIGAEYGFMNTLMLRAGYNLLADGDLRAENEQGVTLGVGVRQRIGGIGLGADYAYTDFGIFDNVHRVALQISL
jgi:hypothetical protein